MQKVKCCPPEHLILGFTRFFLSRDSLMFSPLNYHIEYNQQIEKLQRINFEVQCTFSVQIILKDSHVRQHMRWQDFFCKGIFLATFFRYKYNSERGCLKSMPVVFKMTTECNAATYVDISPNFLGLT